MTRVILGSGSPRRRELLAALIPAYDVISADIPEPMGSDPREDAVRLAAAKAQAVASAHPGALVIGADTIVHDGVRAFGKPVDPADAVATWHALRGRDHRVVTGIAVAHHGAVATGLGESRVRLANISDAAVEAYVASGRPLDKAGAYAIQDQDVPTVEALDGCYCCVVGLPLWRLRALLVGAGLTPSRPDTVLARCADCPDWPTEVASGAR